MTIHSACDVIVLGDHILPFSTLFPNNPLRFRICVFCGCLFSLPLASGTCNIALKSSRVRVICGFDARIRFFGDRGRDIDTGEKVID